MKGGQAFALDVGAWFFQRDRATSVRCLGRGREKRPDTTERFRARHGIAYVRCNLIGSGSGALSMRVWRCLPPRVLVETTGTIARRAS